VREAGVSAATRRRTPAAAGSKASLQARLPRRPGAVPGPRTSRQPPSLTTLTQNSQVDRHEAAPMQRWRGERGSPMLAARGRNRRRGGGVGCGYRARNDAASVRPYRWCGCGTGSALSQPEISVERAQEPTPAVAGHDSPTLTPRGDDAQPRYCHARRLRGGGEGRRRLGPSNKCFLRRTSAVAAAAPPRGRQRERERRDVAEGAACMCSRQRLASEDHVQDISLSHGYFHYFLRTSIVAVR